MKRYLLVTLLSLVSIFGGCININEDVTHNPIYQTDYVGTKVYRTKVPVFVQELGRARVLRLPGSGDVHVPSTVEFYLRAGRERWPEITSLLEAGTRLRLKRIIRRYNGEMGNMFHVIAEVLDAPNSGLEVDLSMISLERRQKEPAADVPIINPSVIEESNG
jgi:hypothetical protein